VQLAAVDGQLDQLPGAHAIAAVCCHPSLIMRPVRPA
jgi:hypothetical protein